MRISHVREAIEVMRAVRVLCHSVDAKDSSTLSNPFLACAGPRLVLRLVRSRDDYVEDVAPQRRGGEPREGLVIGLVG